jgi:Na+-driven multidrug efflux pump
MTPPAAQAAVEHERRRVLPAWAVAAAAEVRAQRGIALPLMGTNLTWFAKMAVTNTFLGRLGELELAAGTLGRRAGRRGGRPWERIYS